MVQSANVVQNRAKKGNNVGMRGPPHLENLPSNRLLRILLNDLMAQKSMKRDCSNDRRFEKQSVLSACAIMTIIDDAPQ